MASLRVALRLSMREAESSDSQHCLAAASHTRAPVATAEASTEAPAIPEATPSSPVVASAPRPSMPKKRRFDIPERNRERPRFPRRAGSFTEEDREATNLKSVLELAGLIAAGQRVVFVTGAGLSCASGIPPFRASRFGAELDGGAVWSQHIETMGTRRAFEKDPLEWYNSFWLPSFAPRLLAKPANEGHHALAALAAVFPGISVITQNVDGLHQQARPEWGSADRLIEAHGRVGLYKCSDDPGDGSDSAVPGSCPFASQRSILPEMFSETTWLELGHGATEDCSSAPRLTTPPPCPNCGRPCMPQALLFDEVCGV